MCNPDANVRGPEVWIHNSGCITRPILSADYLLETELGVERTLDSFFDSYPESTETILFRSSWSTTSTAWSWLHFPPYPQLLSLINVYILFWRSSDISVRGVRGAPEVINVSITGTSAMIQFADLLETAELGNTWA